MWREVTASKTWVRIPKEETYLEEGPPFTQCWGSDFIKME